MFPEIYDKTIILSPKEYIDFLQKSKDNIEKVEFVYPEIGKINFGQFKVRLKNTNYGYQSSKKRTLI